MDAERRTRQRTDNDEGSSAPRELAPEPESGQPLQLRVDLQSLFNNPSLSDVRLVAKGEQSREFLCHRVILASMSTYFCSLFTTGMQESSQSVVVLGVEPDCCERVLRLLYGQSVEITQENVLTYMHLADFYGSEARGVRALGLPPCAHT